MFATLAAAQETGETKSADKKAAGAEKAKPDKALDEELFKDLSNDLFEGLGDDPFKKKPAKESSGKGGEEPSEKAPLDSVSGEDLGEEDNPLLSLGRRMREVEQRIAESRADRGTQSLQEEIVTALERLIEQARRQQQQQNSSSSSSSQPQQTAQRDKVKQPGQPKSGSPQNGQGQENRQPSDSSEREGPRKVQPVDMGQLNDLAKALWGHLPERVRQQMQQSPLDHFLPKYELQIEDYFKRLSNRYEDRP